MSYFGEPTDDKRLARGDAEGNLSARSRTEATGLWPALQLRRGQKGSLSRQDPERLNRNRRRSLFNQVLDYFFLGSVGIFGGSLGRTGIDGLIGTLGIFIKSNSSGGGTTPLGESVTAAVAVEDLVAEVTASGVLSFLVRLDEKKEVDCFLSSAASEVRHTQSKEAANKAPDHLVTACPCLVRMMLIE